MTTVPARLIAAATELFASRGYEGTSVRAICSAAETNLNAVSYHFGGKKGLYVAVLHGVGERRLASAQRILATPAATSAELETRLVLFAEETIASWLQEPGVLNILQAELAQGFRNSGPEAFESLAAQSRVLVAFLTSARDDGLLRSDVDVEMMAGGLSERISTQVMYVDTLHERFGNSIKNQEYRSYWVRQVIGLLLHGANA
ncbi:MAG: TetR/AcrR family transcriptional regulator [Proteobacteria bacterium]|nr:TetR/AcrR family transcriptional regulator [Pseudomonadota bacterium]